MPVGLSILILRVYLLKPPLKPIIIVVLRPYNAFFYRTFLNIEKSNGGI